MIGDEHSIAIADHFAVGAAVRAVYRDTHHGHRLAGRVQCDPTNGAQSQRGIVSTGE
jgi:hypothetical protein